MKVMTIVGARPQFIKAAVVSRAFKENCPEVSELIVHTGQHYDSNMSEVFFDELDIPRPNINLGVGGGSHGQNTGRMLESLESSMLAERPDWVLVYGDTDSTLAGALAASKVHIPVAHVEAGLRSFNRKMPEEINRVLTDHIADFLFVPTVTGKLNLIKEGIFQSKIFLSGDVMFDAALYYKRHARMPKIDKALQSKLSDFVLCTIHRAENTDNYSRMSEILKGLGQGKEAILLPLHPRTRKKIIEMELSVPSNIHIIDPVSYLEMVWLEVNCKLVVTDSGGVQKEAYFHGKPCVTLRDETEWSELVDLGVNVLVGANAERIADSITNFNYFKNIENLYGNGSSGLSIVKTFQQSNS